MTSPVVNGPTVGLLILSVIGVVVLLANVPQCDLSSSSFSSARDCDTRNQYWYVVLASGASAAVLAVLLFGVAIIHTAVLRIERRITSS